MESPIQNRIGQVFVPVSDMKRAIEWYSKLLGPPMGNTSHEGTIYDVPMQGDTRLSMDASKEQITNSSQPLFFFRISDIHEALSFLKQNGVEVLTEVTDVGSVTFVVFRDPDQNMLMVCQPNR